MPNAYLCVLSPSLSLSLDTLLRYGVPSSATQLAEDDEHLRYCSSGALAELPALRALGAMPFAFIY